MGEAKAFTISFLRDWFPVAGVAALLLTVGAYRSDFENTKADVAHLESLDPAVVKSNQARDEHEEELFRGQVFDQLKLLSAEVSAIGGDTSYLRGHLDGKEGGK